MDQIYKFRIILDSKEDVFRDIEMDGTKCLEEFSDAILQAFGIAKGEMAAFYKSDEDWGQGEEIPLLDMGHTEEPAKLMCEHTIKNVFTEVDGKMIYVYDFMNMWTFYVEFLTVLPAQVDTTYPNFTYAFGETPAEAPEKNFNQNPSDDIFGDAFDEDDMFEDEGYDEDYGI